MGLAPQLEEEERGVSLCLCLPAPRKGQEHARRLQAWKSVPLGPPFCAPARKLLGGDSLLSEPLSAGWVVAARAHQLLAEKREVKAKSVTALDSGSVLRVVLPPLGRSLEPALSSSAYSGDMAIIWFPNSQQR